MGSNGDTNFVAIKEQRIETTEPIKGIVMIVFTDIAANKSNGRIRYICKSTGTRSEIEANN
ncbi:hypothetical protein ACFX5D_06645 [Flavobacterium sp. LB3P45]|uniref:Uncharacterized protein n=1 Tax=Flavobacterium fructosi TaxID=3230416 RepID=A0ABW6HMA0_9FLAO